MKPVLQALILADHIYEDIRTRKKIIAGTFTALFFKRATPPVPTSYGMDPLPGAGEQEPGRTTVIPGPQAGSPWVYICLTDFVGDDEFTLRYVDLSNDNMLLQTQFRIKSENPLQAIELCVPLPPLPTPHPGEYVVELLWRQEPLGSWRVSVTEFVGEQ